MRAACGLLETKHANGPSAGKLCRVACLILLSTALASCKPADQKTASLSADDVREARSKLSEEVRAHVDSGNSAYKLQNYELALKHYRTVAQSAPDEAVGWFGIYMAQRALGNAAGADSALERAQKIAPGATLLRPKENKKKKQGP